MSLSPLGARALAKSRLAIAPCAPRVAPETFMPQSVDTASWPELPYAAWKDTCATLHLRTQSAGKVRLALTPWLNPSWHVTLYVPARGLSTGPMPFDSRNLEIEFDFNDHVLWLRTSDGHSRQIMLRPVSVAEFYADVMLALSELGVSVRINEMANEIPDATRVTEARAPPAYDPDSTNRLFRVLPVPIPR